MTNAPTGPGTPPDPDAPPAPGAPQSRVTASGDLEDWNGSRWVPHQFLAPAPVGGDPQPAVSMKVAGDEAKERAAAEALAELELEVEDEGEHAGADGDQGKTDGDQDQNGAGR